MPVPIAFTVSILTFSPILVFTILQYSPLSLYYTMARNARLNSGRVIEENVGGEFMEGSRPCRPLHGL